VRKQKKCFRWLRPVGRKLRLVVHHLQSHAFHINPDEGPITKKIGSAKFGRRRQSKVFLLTLGYWTDRLARGGPVASARHAEHRDRERKEPFRSELNRAAALPRYRFSDFGGENNISQLELVGPPQMSAAEVSRSAQDNRNATRRLIRTDENSMSVIGAAPTDENPMSVIGAARSWRRSLRQPAPLTPRFPRPGGPRRP
jgi:hypothetical protein